MEEPSRMISANAIAIAHCLVKTSLSQIYIYIYIHILFLCKYFTVFNQYLISLLAKADLLPNISGSIRDICPFYNSTLSNQDHLTEANCTETLGHFKLLFSLNCSPLAWIFVCSALFPLLSCLSDHLIIPCQNLCFTVFCFVFFFMIASISIFPPLFHGHST